MGTISLICDAFINILYGGCIWCESASISYVDVGFRSAMCSIWSHGLEYSQENLDANGQTSHWPYLPHIGHVRNV